MASALTGPKPRFFCAWEGTDFGMELSDFRMELFRFWSDAGSEVVSDESWLVVETMLSADWIAT